ncbi:MAG: hypothetical protein K2Q34_02805 [Alphaproteobacteria bacterium]|nr:hypothetical protein [Alphaproteobacteria bacterium]
MKRVFFSLPVSCSLSLILSFSTMLGGHGPAYASSLKEVPKKQRLQPLTLSNLGQLKGTYAIYWGYFDPPTLAHKEIIVQSLNQLGVDKIIVVLNNPKAPDKNNPTDINQRFKMMDILLHDYKDKIILVIQDEGQKADYHAVKKHIVGKLYAVAGQDSYEKWAQYEKNLMAYDKIVVVPRYVPDSKQPFASILPPNIMVLKIEKDLYTCSSTKARSHIQEESILQKLLNSKIIRYVKQNNLYRSSAKQVG